MRASHPFGRRCVVPWRRMAPAGAGWRHMADVRISPASGTELRELAAMMAEAFAGEAIHRFVLDFGREGTQDALLRPFTVELESAAAGGCIVLAASVEGRIVGGATLCKCRRSSLRLRIREGLRWLRAIVPLLPAVRWRNVLLLHGAARLLRPIIGSHFVLPALAVHPAFQRRGIGPQLLEAIHERVERDGQALGVYLYTGERKSQQMYEKAGYRTIETRQAGALTIYHMFRTNGGGFVTAEDGGASHDTSS